MTNHAKDFLNTLDKIKPSKSRWEVFSDWLILASSTLYAWKKDSIIEAEYTEIAKQYNADELEKFGDLLGITVLALEEKEQDLLGEVFSLGNLHNTHNGQFFTPYHISELMSEIAIGENAPKNNRVLRINEPCCGSGGMVIANISVLKKRGFNYQRDAYFVCTDIDARCARMTFIQLSLLAAPAIIICGNTLTLETYWQRETIGYHIAGMDFRLKAESMIDFMTKTDFKQIAEKTTEEKMEKEIKLPSSRNLVQGELF